MKFGEHLLGTVQFNRSADPRGDRAICGHAHKHVQPVRFETEFPVKRVATWIVDCDISFHLINFQAGRFEDVLQKHVGETCSPSFLRYVRVRYPSDMPPLIIMRFAARMLQLHRGIRPQMFRR